uniref:Putative lipocalin n=1 Tax=Rhipicephalus microplus TaxID=6941 RepID=A0A6G5A337_RHIMP
MASFKMHLALTIVFGICGYAIKYPPNWKASRLRDFQEMLNTEEKIWLTMTTKDMRRLDCDYWTKISLNDTDYDFNHWYRKQPKGREWTKQGPQKRASIYTPRFAIAAAGQQCLSDITKKRKQSESAQASILVRRRKMRCI